MRECQWSKCIVQVISTLYQVEANFAFILMQYVSFSPVPSSCIICSGFDEDRVGRRSSSPNQLCISCSLLLKFVLMSHIMESPILLLPFLLLILQDPQPLFSPRAIIRSPLP